MRKYPKTKQVSPLKKVAYQEVNQSYTYSELETADQEQIKNLAKPTLDKEQPAMLVLQSEELNSMISRIPDGHLLSNLTEELIDHVSLKLDAPSTLSGWRKVGLALGVDKDRLDLLEREDKRRGGSPTAELLKGLNAQFPDALTKTFVEALHREKRDDIAKSICNWKW